MKLRSHGIGLVILAACGGGGSTPDAPKRVDATPSDGTQINAPLSFSDASSGGGLEDIDFPGTAIGSSSSDLVTAMDGGTTGTGPITLSFVEPGSGATDYELDQANTTCNVGDGIAAGSSCTISIIFAPTGSGERVGQLDVDLTDNATYDAQLLLHGFAD